MYDINFIEKIAYFLFYSCSILYLLSSVIVYMLSFKSFTFENTSNVTIEQIVRCGLDGTYGVATAAGNEKV